MTPPLAGPTADPLADTLRAWQALLAAWPGAGVAPGALSGIGGIGGVGATTAAPLEGLLMQAQWLCGASLVRSGQRAAQSWLQYTQAAPADAAPEARADAARAHLRRLAEIAVDEARSVGQQLMALDEQVCNLVVAAAPAAATPVVRRARPKA
jgi:hypothetical protein